ncbi:NmrA family transcriptional regulator [Penicillium herquei]|nr:NmrA family transcriptional regulator [Penicillium herquei]
MSKLLVVFGATGQQGGSVIDYVLNDPDLSKEYSLRGITRSASSDTAKDLQKRGVEIVEADASDAKSIPAAVAGAHTVFIVTISIYDEHLKTREIEQTKQIADAAVATGAKFLIYSTCVAAERLHGFSVPAFDSKADCEQYIRTLPIKSAFFAPGMFMQNFLGNQIPRPVPDQKDTYAIYNFISPDAPLPLIDTLHDTGKYLGPILVDPDRYDGKIFCCATAQWSYKQVAEIITRVTGKKTIYLQIPYEQWLSFLPPGYKDSISAMMRFIETPGYFGPSTKEDVEWTVQQVRKKLTTFEEFVEKHSESLFASD